MNPSSSQSQTESAARPVILGVRRVPGRQNDTRLVPHFRPPALPALQWAHDELPFTAHLGPRLRARP
ncbi:MAG: hypothetical protein Q8N18_21305 [Opitutaceae bacterium]|nr:hypothetical protein [Opitutaceae bacterium]